MRHTPHFLIFIIERIGFAFLPENALGFGKERLILVFGDEQMLQKLHANGTKRVGNLGGGDHILGRRNQRTVRMVVCQNRHRGIGPDRMLDQLTRIHAHLIDRSLPQLHDLEELHIRAK